jgi:3-phenylpropionate/trans-cinnamate dioxygenase ferredoxin subunit
LIDGCAQVVNVPEGWTEVCARDELLPGEFKVVWDGDTAIAVYNVDGDLYAIEDVCTHDGGDLAGGEVHGFEVECPRHGARFDLRSGEATLAPATEPVAAFPVRVEAGRVYTRDDR